MMISDPDFCAPDVPVRVKRRLYPSSGMTGKHSCISSQQDVSFPTEFGKRESDKLSGVLILSGTKFFRFQSPRQTGFKLAGNVLEPNFFLKIASFGQMVVATRDEHDSHHLRDGNR